MCSDCHIGMGRRVRPHEEMPPDQPEKYKIHPRAFVQAIKHFATPHKPAPHWRKHINNSPRECVCLVGEKCWRNVYFIGYKGGCAGFSRSFDCMRTCIRFMHDRRWQIADSRYIYACMAEFAFRQYCAGHNGLVCFHLYTAHPVHSELHANAFRYAHSC